MTNNTKYYVAFSHCYGIGPVIFKQLLQHFGDVKSAYLAKDEDLKKTLGPNSTRKFLDFKREFRLENIEESFLKKEIQVLTLEDKNYPNALKNISDPPICLYVRGNAKIFAENELFFAIVGTRKITLYGGEVTRYFAQELSNYGFVIVSGMAIGVDSVAHWAAIDTGGKTVAVLGCGVDIIYPYENAKLYHKIIEIGGAVISEFPPGMTVLPGLFVARNRIVSGLSRGVLVVEGAERSGTLITARHAAEQGRDVFAPPSPITSASSKAPNILIKQGAKMVTTISDILEEYDINIKASEKKGILSTLAGLEKDIFELLLNEPLAPDNLSLKVKKPVTEILNSLTLLEIRGIIKKDEEGKYFPFF